MESGLMSHFNKVIVDTDNASGDAFGRLRVSNLTTLFDSKQINDNMPLFWDDSEVSGSGTTSTYNANQASTTIAVGATTAGKRVRQTFQRFNYQPGKSQLVVLTALLADAGVGNTACLGYFDDKNGLFFMIKDSVMSVVRRTYTSGSAVNTVVEQSSFNIDKMDGTGSSGVTLDPSKTQIMFMDFEWLGVGRVRMGFYNAGVPIYCHEFLHANVESLVYMSTPNLPLRYEIENDGTGPAASLLHMCSSVASEGGITNLGILRHEDSGSVSSLSTGTKYAILGIRLKSTHTDVNVILKNLSLLATSQNDLAHWELQFNPSVAGTFTYADVTNSAIQVAQGASTNTVTNGTHIDGGYFSTTLPISPKLDSSLRLGAAIDGTVDEIVLVVRPITNNITVEGSLTWRELS